MTVDETAIGMDDYFMPTIPNTIAAQLDAIELDVTANDGRTYFHHTSPEAEAHLMRWRVPQAQNVLDAATTALLAKGVTQDEIDTIKARALKKAQKEGW